MRTTLLVPLIRRYHLNLLLARQEGEEGNTYFYAARKLLNQNELLTRYNVFLVLILDVEDLSLAAGM